MAILMVVWILDFEIFRGIRFFKGRDFRDKVCRDFADLF